jgi:hypothetical protein
VVTSSTPSGSFVSNDAALLAWTEPANALDPDQLPADKKRSRLPREGEPETPPPAEVQVVPLVKIAGTWGLYDFLDRHLAALDVPGQNPRDRLAGRREAVGGGGPGGRARRWWRGSATTPLSA